MDKEILDKLPLEEIKRLVEKSRQYLVESGREKYYIEGKAGKQIREREIKEHNKLMSYYKERKMKEQIK